MKSKFLLILLAALTVGGISLNAQDRKMTETEIKLQQDQYHDRYELQKKTLQDAYNNDMKAIADQKNLTPMERKAKRDAIRDRYLQQKHANQDAYKVDKDRLQARRKALNDGKIKMDDDKMKVKDEKGNKMKMKHDMGKNMKVKHSVKPNKPGKH